MQSAVAGIGGTAPEQFADRMRAIVADESHGWQETRRRAVDAMLLVLREHGYGDGCDIFDGFRRD